jgi:hypothetical protein
MNYHGALVYNGYKVELRSLYSREASFALLLGSSTWTRTGPNVFEEIKRSSGPFEMRSQLVRWLVRVQA